MKAIQEMSKGFHSYMTCARCKQEMTVVSFPVLTKKHKKTNQYEFQTITSHDGGCPKPNNKVKCPDINDNCKQSNGIYSCRNMLCKGTSYI